MAEPNNTNGGESNSAAAGDESGYSPVGGDLRIWISVFVFLVFGVVTFLAGADNRWVSIPAAIIATVALIDFLTVNQRRRRARSR